mgnify:CR=1 FL=1
MSRRAVLRWGFVAALAAGAQGARAGGTRDLMDGWVVPASSVAALLSAPSAAAAPDGPWASLGQGRLYGLRELPLAAAAAGWRAPRWEAALAWQHLGSGLWREERLRARLLVGRAARVGLAAGWDALRLAGQASGERWAALSCEVEFDRPGAWCWRASFPLRPCPPWYGEGGARRWLGVSGGASGFGWAVALDRDARGVPLLEGEALAAIGGGGALGLRWEPATGSLGATTAWLRLGLLLRTSHLAHPALGVTHRFALGFGRVGEVP